MISVTGKLALDGRAWDAGIRGAEKSADRFSNHLSSTVKARIGAVFSTAIVAAMARKVIDFASNISDLSARLGIAADELQRFFFAAKQSGGSDEAVVSFLEKLNVARAKALGGSAEMIAAFKELGVTLGDLKSKRVEDLTKQIANVVRDSDPQKIIEPLKEVGGRAAGELIATFVNGLEEVGKTARVISKDNVAALDDIGDRFSAFSQMLMVELAPAIVFVLGKLQNWVTNLRAISSFLGGVTADTGNREKGNNAFERALSRAKMRIGFGVEQATAVIDEALTDMRTVSGNKKKRESVMKAIAGQGFDDMLDPSGFKSKEKQEKPDLLKREIRTDSLVRVGNFLGSTGSSNIVAISQRSLEKLSSIDRHIKLMYQQRKEGSSLSEYTA